MNRRFRWLSISAAVAALGPWVQGAEADSEPVTALPPFVVTEDATDKPDWIVYRDDEREILSACTEETTERFVSVLRKRRDQLNQLVPDGLLFMPKLSTTLILFPSSDKGSMERTVFRMLGPPAGGSMVEGRLRPMDDLRLADEDSVYLFVFVDDAASAFESPGRGQQGEPELDFMYSPKYLRFLLDARAPALPGWFRTGLTRLYRTMEFSPDGASFRPDPWVSQSAAEDLRSDGHALRSLVPMGELFSAYRPAGKSEDYQRIWSAQSELFVRWALSGAVRGGRERLWRLVAASTEQPVTETLFQSCFGMTYSDARDALSDFLPSAVTRRAEGPPWKAAPATPVKLRQALPTEVRRILGEWARRAREIVAANPEAEHLYSGEARRLLEGAFSQGDRDPGLLASLALFRIETGAATDGLRLLDENPEACAARPLANLELARLRLEDALRLPRGPKGSLSADQAAAVMGPVARALDSGPPMEAAYLLATRTFEHLGRDPRADEREILVRGARLFSRNSDLVVRCASLILRAGDFDGARDLIRRGLWDCSDSAQEAKLLQLDALAQGKRPDVAK